MAPALLLQPTTEADLEAIADLESHCPGGWSLSQLQTATKQPGAWHLVARQSPGGELIGYIFGLTVLDEAEIYRLVVAPSFRRQGYARQMLNQSIDRLRQAGGRDVYLEVRESNLPAIALYRQAGFAATSTRKRYYRNPPEDGVVMRLTIRLP